MPSARGPPVDEWKRLESVLLGEGLSRFQAHCRIARDYGVTRSTVYRQLTPKVRDYVREYQREWRRRPELRERRREYWRAYARAYRLVPHLADELVAGRRPLTVDEFVKRAETEIRQRTGISMSGETVYYLLGTPSETDFSPRRPKADDTAPHDDYHREG